MRASGRAACLPHAMRRRSSAGQAPTLLAGFFMAAALGACYSTNPTGGAAAAWVQNLGSIAIVDVDNGTP